jgi:hypothetical protein
MQSEFERQRAERRRLLELERSMRMDNERAVRLILDEYFPAGIPDDLLERICAVQNRLIKNATQDAKTIREMHDGINRIADEAAQREVDGFNECASQVRRFGAELGLAPTVIDSLLRNQVRGDEAERADKNRAATRQVQWSRT